MLIDREVNLYIFRKALDILFVSRTGDVIDKNARQYIGFLNHCDKSDKCNLT